MTAETVTGPEPLLVPLAVSWDARLATQGEGSPVAAARAAITLSPLTLPSWILTVRTLLVLSQLACAPGMVGSLRMRKTVPLRVAALGRLARLEVMVMALLGPNGSRVAVASAE